MSFPRAAAGGIEVPRTIGQLRRATGPMLLAVGGLHGNEPAGALGLARVFEALSASPQRPVAGTFIGLAGNVKALAHNRRFVREDLNRIWLPERLAPVRAASGPLADEEEELAELDRELAAALATAKGRTTILDLHSVSGPGAAFVTLDDTLANRATALQIPTTCVLGLEEELQGTLTDYFVNLGLSAFGFESGQLVDPGSVDRAEAAVWVVLEATGILRGEHWPEVARSRHMLRRHRGTLPEVVEVRHRHAIDPSARFTMRPGFASFQPVRAGEPLASDATGTIEAPLDGLMLMPLYQGQGSDGFFIVRRVRPVWLAVSSLVRRLPLRGWLWWLPGVTRDETQRDSYVVDTRKARWLALELFHLLGFKRRRHAAHTIVMSPRKE